MENAELNEKKIKMEMIVVKIEEMEKENEGLKNEQSEYVDVQKDEIVDSENENEEFVNVQEDESVPKKRKDKNKVHQLAKGLNIPVGGMMGGVHPMLAKKKREAMEAKEHREMPQQKFAKPVIPSDQRSPKKKANIAPFLDDDDDLKTDL